MKIFNTSIRLESPTFGKYRRIAAIITLFALFFTGDVRAQGGCSSLTPSFINFEPCKYRVQIVNTSECTPSFTVLIDPGEFESWSANTAGGWTGQLLAPNLVQLTHSQGFVPLGTSFPMIFTLPVDLVTLGNFTWEFTCGLGEGCTLFPGIELVSCPDPKDASIIGVKYRECESLPYTNQATIPDWPIQLLDVDGNVLREQVTDAGGAYSFYDLPVGNYVVKETQQPGWMWSVPASGMYAVTLAPSQQAVRNFGNCPECSCDSIYLDVVQLPGISDSCTYALNVTNTGAYCFNQINISLAAGTFASVTPSTGWEAVLTDSQHIVVRPVQGFIVLVSYEPCKYRASGANVHEMTVTTFYNIGQGNVTCSRAFSYPCPPPTSPTPCCPAGSSFGNEQVLNGDFQQGTLAFTNSYTYFTPGGPTMIGKYSVLNQSQVYTANPQWACLDHTTLSATGNMLIVDGYGGPIAWQQTVNVTAGTNYAYSAWFNNLVRPPKNYSDPQMALFVGNTQIAGPLNLPETPDQWVRLCGTWTAMASGPVVLSIRMLSTANIGNDVAIDDVSFRACIAPPCSVSISANPTPFCGTGTLTANPTGLAPFSYQWCQGQNTQTINVQGLPCGSVCSVSVTCADGSMSTASYTITDNVPPTAVCNTGVGVDLGANCIYQVSPAFVDGGSSDNCQIQSLSVSPSVITGCGVTTVTLTVTDWCNNTSTCTMGIQTIEVVPPIITCPDNIYVLGALNAVGQCKAIVTGLLPTASDNCGVPTVTYQISTPTGGSGIGDASGTNFMQGTSTVTYTATDGCNNISSCSFRVEVTCSNWSCDCPQGNTTGPELVLNGTFQSVIPNFNSDYAPLFPSCSPKEFIVTDPVQVTTVCNNWAATDHTTGNTTTGWKFFAADGSQILGDNAWKQQVTLTKDKTYNFCAWVKNLNLNLDRPDPIVEAYVLDASMNPIGGPIATTGPLPEPPTASGWVFIGGSFTASASGTYFLAIRTAGTSFEGNNFALDDISFRECTPPPSCTCANPSGFSNMSYKANSGPNVSIDCGQIAIWQCFLPTFNLSGNFMCQGNACPATNPMSWTLKNPANNIVNSGTMTSPSFLVSIPSATFYGPGIYTLTLAGICGSDTCYCEIKIETPGCACACPQGNATGPELVLNGTFQSVIPNFSSDYAPLFPSCSPKEFIVTDPVQVTTVCNNWAATDHTTGNSTPGWLFFAADGSQTLGDNAWKQPVTLNAGKTYNFCAWVKNLNLNLDRPDPIVEAYVLDASMNPIGGPIATTGPLPEPPTASGWVGITGSFTASVGGSHFLAIRTAGTSFEGNNFALDDISFRECTPPPSCTCANPSGFSNMSYKANSGPNVSIDCGQIAIWQCVLPTFNLSGNFMCQGNACPAPIPMSWTLKNPANNIVNNGTMTSPSFLVSIPSGTFSGSGIYTLTLVGICGSDTCYCEIKIETPGCPCDCPQGNTTGPELVLNGTFQAVIPNFSSDYAPLFPSCSPKEFIVTDPVQVTTVCNNWAATDHTTGNTTTGWKFFAADGSQTLGDNAWKQPVTLTAGKTYNFCAWVKNLNLNLDRPDPIVEAYVLDASMTPIGGPIATTGPLPEPPTASGWVGITGSFTASVGGSHFLAIRTAGTSFEGNNFALDDISFRECTPVVSVSDQFRAMLIRIYPNPNTGTFTLELPEPAKLGTTFRITDLTGRLVLEQKTESGSAQQTVRAGALPAGLYFLQVVSDGKVLAIEKFVKQ